MGQILAAANPIKHTILITTLFIFFAAIPSYATRTVVDQTNFCLSCVNGGQGVINDNTFPFTYREVAQTFTVANDGMLRRLNFWGVHRTSITKER